MANIKQQTPKIETIEYDSFGLYSKKDFITDGKALAHEVFYKLFNLKKLNKFRSQAENIENIMDFGFKSNGEPDLDNINGWLYAKFLDAIKYGAEPFMITDITVSDTEVVVKTKFDENDIRDIKIEQELLNKLILTKEQIENSDLLDYELHFQEITKEYFKSKGYPYPIGLFNDIFLRLNGAAIKETLGKLWKMSQQFDIRDLHGDKLTFFAEDIFGVSRKMGKRAKIKVSLQLSNKTIFTINENIRFVLIRAEPISIIKDNIPNMPQHQQALGLVASRQLPFRSLKSVMVQGTQVFEFAAGSSTPVDKYTTNTLELELFADIPARVDERYKLAPLQWLHQNMSSAIITEIIEPGEDVESDEELKKRIVAAVIESVNKQKGPININKGYDQDS
ncbi:MAG: hypothetical protein QXH92_04425 [Candidatus Aenigmatarchaeota archaeon]